MQNKGKKTNKKVQLVYKPYKKGSAYNKGLLKRSLRVLAYFFLFLFLYFILGTALQFDNQVLTMLANLLVVFTAGGLMFMDGARVGEGDVAFGETVLTREEKGRGLSKDDIARCYHPMKAVVTAFLGVVPILLLTIPFAVTSEKQVYILQGLPSWVSSFREGYADMAAPLSYYPTSATLTAWDILRVIVRLLNLPFVSMVNGMEANALLWVDRLCPILVCLPAVGYPLGYLTGPRHRAMVHGNISRNQKRNEKMKRKAEKARRNRNTQKTNQII